MVPSAYLSYAGPETQGGPGIAEKTAQSLHKCPGTTT